MNFVTQLKGKTYIGYDNNVFTSTDDLKKYLVKQEFSETCAGQIAEAMLKMEPIDPETVRELLPLRGRKVKKST